jgi:hypothetical protein
VTFVKREINLAFVLGEGSFGEGDSDAVEITGLRTSVQVTRAGGVSMSSLNLRVWGMPLDLMQKLSVLNILAIDQYRKNTITVTAGDAVNGYGVVFSGGIINAWIDADNAPDVCFVVSSFEGMTDKVRPVIPNSFKGPASVDVLLSSIARQMQPPMGFENNGVDTVLDNSYFPGTLRDQALKIAADAGCEIFFGGPGDNVIAVWPKGGSRGGAILEVSAATGLVGYPQFSQTGITFTTIYNPSLAYGQKIRMRSALGLPADGDWICLNITHNLDSEIPGGQWFTTVECGLGGYTPPLR